MVARLGLDASLSIPSCAVATDHGIVVKMAEGKPVENFSTLIRETLFQAHVSLEDLNEIVVCIGPGSQMGARTTVATGNALALALGIPISGVLSVDALAVTEQVSVSLSAAVSDGRGHWYVAKYQWSGSNLQRLNGVQLFDKLSTDAVLSFAPDSMNFNEARIGAHGVLIVAAQQRHLITQSMLQEIIPFERGEDSVR